MDRQKPVNANSTVEQPGKLTEKINNKHPFLEIFQTIDALQAAARDEICRTCNWSIPTFYRRLRNSSIEDPRRGVSYADMKAIAEVYVSNIQRLQTLVTKIQDRLIKEKKF